MLTYFILNVYFRYFKCLLTSFLMPTNKILKNNIITGPIRNNFLNRPSPIPMIKIKIHINKNKVV